jgi:heptose-I-phosphate ethanolaminephosphotransferase
MGSHSSYEKRYPTKFTSFNTEQSSTKQQTIDNYDNSILYNDYLVDSLFSQLEDYENSHTNTSFASVYLSDHGENVYDEFDNAGHDYTISIPKSNVEVPFVVYLSANFKKMNKEKYNSITQNRTLPFVTDDLFHSIIDLASIRTPFLEKSRSVFDSSFNSKRVRVLEDKLDYDKK